MDEKKKKKDGLRSGEGRRGDGRGSDLWPSREKKLILLARERENYASLSSARKRWRQIASPQTD